MWDCLQKDRTASNWDAIKAALGSLNANLARVRRLIPVVMRRLPEAGRDDLDRGWSLAKEVGDS